MLPQIVIVLFVLICILIIKIKEFIEKNSDTIFSIFYFYNLFFLCSD